MGSTGRRVATPPSHKQPTSARTVLAKDVVDHVLDHVVRQVFEVHTWINRERECYEVAMALRGEVHAIQRVIRDDLPGSAITPDGVAFNRMTLDAKVAMVLIDKLVADVVRPGPVPEDRQACDLSAEARGLRGELVELVTAVIDVDDKARGLA